MFSEPEITYLRLQRLARIATVSKDSQPDVAPVGFEFDGQYFYVGGLDQTRTHKYKNVLHGNHKVALVVDDLESIKPWKPRGIKIHGEAEIVERQGQLGAGPYLRILPKKYWSWGIEKPAFDSGQVAMKRQTVEGE